MPHGTFKSQAEVEQLRDRLYEGLDFVTGKRQSGRVLAILATLGWVLGYDEDDVEVVLEELEKSTRAFSDPFEDS